jgi:carboxyl-terminal processing protease
MRKYVKSALTATALVATFGGTLSYYGLRAEESAGTASSYDLAALRILNRVILLVRENYVDPKRIKPRQMLLGALDYVQKTVAEVLVDSKTGSSDVAVRVNGESRSFNIDGLDNLWEMSFKLRDIFQYIQANLKGDHDFKEIEYSAINGLLNTLDPHSVLLRPEVYREMDLGTKGHFGGLGIVISIRDGALTVISPLEGTPAHRAGLKSGDKIVQIEEESTINMSLTEAVNRLRGKPGTKVTIWVQRKGWTEPRRYSIVRDDIKIRSVESRTLAPGIGFIKVKNFDANTSGDLRAHLRRLRRKGKLRGLVLDLRNNPGGLFKSAVEVSNLWLSSGIIVTTVGMGEKVREEQRASGGGEEGYPIAVLVNSGSASASEIVSGALKNLNRALVFGQQTFGKGSVQVLYNFKDGSALKLTVAQYLTPGDLSIQSVGITPDILTLPVVIDKEEIDFFGPETPFREKDLKKHLTWEAPAKQEQALAKVKFLEPRKDKEKERDAPDPEKFVLDVPIQLARDVVAAAAKVGATTRNDVYSATKALIAQRMREEAAKITRSLKRLGIDWSERGVGPAGAPDPQFTFSTHPGPKLKAGEKVELRVTVENKGTGDLYQLRAMTKSDNQLWDRRELVFGRVPAGESRTWALPLKLPKDTRSRWDHVTFKFYEGERELPQPLEALVHIEGLPRPIFGYAMQLVEVEGNGDGLIQHGETFELRVTVKNVGEGKALEALATLKNNSGKGIYIQRGRIKLETVEPEKTKAASFAFRVLPRFGKPQADLEVAVVDNALREYVTEKLKLKIDGAGDRTVVARNDGVEVSVAEAVLRVVPDAAAPVAGRVKKGTVLLATGTVPGWYRVKVGEGVAWIAANEASAAGGAPTSEPAVSAFKTPPRLKVAFTERDLLTSSPTIRLSGEALDDERVQDLYIFVNDKKVYYKSNRDSSFGPHLPFDATLPLKKGKNRILIVARENKDLTSRAILMVLRRS